MKLDYTRQWCDWHIITPKLAEELLKLNVANRAVRKTNVREYAAAMKRGEWRRTHQGIGISKTGRLMDGQHRLLAVVEAGVAVEMMVTTGMEDDDFNILDQHSRRSMADAFRESKMVMEPITLGARVVYGNSATPAQVQTVYTVMRGVVDNLVTGLARKKVLTSASMILAASIIILEGGDKEYVAGLLRSMCASDFDAMPPVAKSLMKQVFDGTAGASKGAHNGDLIARGLTVFDESRAGTQKVIVKEPQLAIERVRTTLRSHIDATSVPA